MSQTASEASAAAPTVPRWLMYAVSFWGGLQIMVLEVCGFRVLQTNLGSSVIVTGTLLTLIMILLAAGYYAGGSLSGRLQSARGLFVMLLISAVYTEVITTLFLDRIGELGYALYELLGNHVYLRTGLPASVLTLVLYGPPVLCMSMISPYWIRLRTADGSGKAADAGFQAGFFMALSTVGSIVGTLFASYIFIPLFGVSTTASATNVVFLCLALLGWIRTRAAAPRMVVARALIVLVAVVGALMALRVAKPGRDPEIVYEAESHYGHMQVRKSTSETGHPMLTYHPSRFVINSMLYLDDPLREMEALMFLMPGLVEPPESILVLGSAAGGILRKIELVFPDAKVTALDLDPKVHEVATEIFQVSRTQHELITADARMHLASDLRKYDLIIVDVFSGEFVPPHCVTTEFFELVRQHLTPEGTVFINTLMYDIHHEVPKEDEPFRAMRHLQSTLFAAGFPTVFENSFFHSLFVFQKELPSEQLRERLLQIYSDPGVRAPLRAGAGLAAYTTVAVLRASRADYRPFTDEWTPALLIELKTNEDAVYEAVRRAGLGSAGAGATARERVPALVLAQRLREAETSGWPMLSQPGPLVRAFNELTDPVTPADLEVAMSYLRFAWEAVENDTPPQSDWGRTAALFADLYRTANQHRYEDLLPVIGELQRLFGVGQG